jgi:flagellar hook-basal body complex protein FliE
MLNTSIIEVVVGLIFVFSLIAILVTQINGIITAVLNLRARQLKDGVRELLTDKQTQARILAHPLIKMVDVPLPASVKLTPQAAEMIVSDKEATVNYIAPTTFVEALKGVLISDNELNFGKTLQDAILQLPGSQEKSKLREALQDIRTNFSETTLRDIRDTIAKISDSGHQAALMEGLQELETKLETLSYRSAEVIPLLNGVNKIADDRLRHALDTVISTAENLQDAETKMEAWFNDGMNRVTDAFKKQVQVISVVVALTLTFLFNIDAIFIARTLYEDPELRQNVAAAAEAFDQNAISEQIDEATDNTENGEAVTAPDAGEQDNALTDVTVHTQEAEDTIQSLLDLQLPIGWQFTKVTDDMVNTSLSLGLKSPLSNSRNLWNFVPGNGDNWITLWLGKLIGLIATTIAASQGAPFWFDLLNKLTRR